MARKTRKKKKVSLVNKVKGHLVSAKNWVLDHANDHDFLPALLLLVVGSMLMFQCLNPWVTLGAAGMLVGAKKMWDIARW